MTNAAYARARAGTGRMPLARDAADHGRSRAPPHDLVGARLVPLALNGDRVAAEEKLLVDLKQRIRDVRQGPDGAIYVLAGNSLLRLSPKK